MQNMQIPNNNKDAMLSVLKSLKGYFLYATLFSASVNFLMLTPIIYMLQVYDRVVSSGSMSTLAMLSLLMVLLLMASGGFEWARSRILVAANVRLENQLRDLVSKASFKHSLLSGSPAASHLAMSDLLGLRQFITGNGVFAFMDAPWTPIYIAVMFMFHPLFGISAVICAVIMIVLAIIMEKLTAQKLLEANKLTAVATQSFQSNLRNAEVIHGMGMQAAIRQKDGKLYQAAGNEQAIGSAAAGRLTAISKSFRLIAQSIVLGLGAYLALNQQISPGMMIAGSLLLGRALAPIDMMVGTWKNFVDAKNSFKRLRLILSSYVEEADRMDLPKPVGNLSVEQIIVIPPGAQADPPPALPPRSQSDPLPALPPRPEPERDQETGALPRAFPPGRQASSRSARSQPVGKGASFSWSLWRATIRRSLHPPGGSDTDQQFRNKPDSPSSVHLSLARPPIPTCGSRLLLPCPVQFFTP